MPSIPNNSVLSYEISEEISQVPFPILSKHLSFNLGRRIENKRRLADSGPCNEVLFNLPEDGPSCYFKRFSQNGRFIFAFGGESRFLVYKLKYPGSIATESGSVKFSDFFVNEPIEIDVISNLRNIPGCPELANTLLCRDFCLTLGSEDFVILASSTPADRYEINDKPPKTFRVQSGNRIKYILNDSHTAFPCLDHVTFYLLNLRTMKVVDFIHFKYDFIYLAHHLGVGLRDGIFSILSMKNQRIFLFEIDFVNGKFIEFNQICRNSQFVDDSVGNKVPEEAESDDSWGRECGIDGFTLKLMKYLSDRHGVHQMPLPSSILGSLHIWKHQLIENDKVLLRVCPGNLILFTNPRHQSMVHDKNSYLILVDRISGDVESVLNSAAPELMDWISENWLWLKGNCSEIDEVERLLHSIETNLNDSMKSDRNSFIRRFTNNLPQSPQQLTESPFFDTKIFRWDPKITLMLSRSSPISCNFFLNSERQKDSNSLLNANYGMEPVKFFSRRRSNEISFKLKFVDETTFLNNNQSENGNTMDRHKWVNVIFHPTLPLILVYQYGIFRSVSLRIFFK